MTRRSNRGYPRYVLPESLQTGDFVRCTYPEEGGVIASYTGTVHHRDDKGAFKVWRNAEGKPLIVWNPLLPKNKRPTVTLIAREIESQQTLEMFDETKERIE